MSYTYDALGRRTSKTVQGGTPTQYLYDVNDIVQETQGSAINPILIGLGVDERFARNDATGRTYFLTDALNSTIALTDSTGAIRQQYSYDPYGNVTPSDTTTGFTNPYQYTGREADAAGLYYYRARYYSPPMGGFISEDPIWFAGEQDSFYAYVAGDPLDARDPMGLCGDDPCKKLEDKIQQVRDELAKRYADLRIDALGLPATGPMSIAGHQQQFENKQTQLRKLLNDYDSQGCSGGLPADAWQYATMPTPSPASSSSGNNSAPNSAAAAETAGALGLGALILAALGLLSN